MNYQQLYKAALQKLDSLSEQELFAFVESPQPATPLSSLPDWKDLRRKISSCVGTYENSLVKGIVDEIMTVVAPLQTENQHLREQLQQVGKNQQFASEFLQRLSNECTHLRDALKEITIMEGDEETLRQAALDYLEEAPAQAAQPPAGEVVDWKLLRKQFFEDCTETVSDGFIDNIVRVNMHPHNLFEWFRQKLLTTQTKGGENG